MRAGGAWLATSLALLAGGCLEASSVVCADGRICPAGLVCSDVNRRCVSPAQLDACQGKTDFDPCEVGGGSGQCQGGACLLAICGDGLVEGTETCDGDNLGQGPDCLDIGYYDQQPLTCDASCRLDENVCTGGKCGDEVVNGPELCDGLPPEIQCVDLGYGVGALPACTARCEPDTALCHRIGIERLSLPAADAAQDVTGSGPDDVYAIARQTLDDGGPLYHNGGVAWLRVLDRVFSVWSVGRDDVYATVWREDGVVLEHFDGSGWSVVDGVTPDPGHRVRASGPDDIDLLGGSNAASMHWDGASWREISALPTDAVIDMWSGGGVTYLVMAETPGDNHLMRFDGAAWEPVLDHGLEQVSAVWGSGPDDVWIGGGRGLARWDGGGWTVDADILPIAGEIAALSGIASDDVYVVAIEDLGVGGGNALLGHLAHFDGAAWNDVAALPGVHEVWAANREAVFMAGNPGSTFRYHGSLWRPELRLSPGPGHAPAGFAVRGDELFAAVNFTAFSDSGLIFRFDGESWDDGTPVSSAQLFGVFLSGSAVYTVGDEGLFRLGAGNQWNPQDVAGGPEPQLRGGWSDGDARFVVGSNLFHDLGDGWVETDRAAPCLGGMTAVWGSAADDVFAVGGCGLIMHFDGEVWTGMDSGTEEGLTAVWGRSGADVYAVGAAGTVLRYDGADWSVMTPLPIPTELRSIAGTEGELFVTGSQGLVFHFDGSSWSQLEPDAVLDQMIEVVAAEREIVFMSLFGTDISALRLLRTTDWRAP